MPRPAAAGGGSAGKNDFVADTNHAVGEDVGVDSSAVDQVFDDAGSGELLQVQAGFAEFDAQALDVADPKSLADQLVEAHTPGHNLTPGLRAAERDVLKRLGFDQRQRLTGRGPVVVEVAVALQTDTGDRGHRLDRRDRIARPDIYCLDLHGPASWDARRWIVRCRTPIMTAPAQPSQRIYGSLTCLDGRDGVPERSRRSALEPAHYRTYTHSLPLGDAPRRQPTGGTARSARSSRSTWTCPAASTSSSSPVGRLPNCRAPAARRIRRRPMAQNTMPDESRPATASLDQKARSSLAAGPAQRWWILGVVGLAQLMVVLDATIVNIALPSAQRDLGFSNADRQWVVTAYSLAFGGLLLLGGRLSDLVGRRRMLIIGLIGFAAASAVGGAASGFAMLVIGRGAQGAFGAMLAPAALSTLTVTFTDPGERGKAFGVYGAIAGAGGAVGLLLGGLLTEYLSWRWCLYVNVILAVIAVAGAIRLLASHPRDRNVHIDWPGSVLVVVGLVSLVYGLSEAETKGWGAPTTVVLLVVGVVLLALFVLVEGRVQHPLLPLRIVMDRFRGGAYLAIGLSAMGMFGIFLFLTYYLQLTLRYSPVMTGLAFLPMVAAIMVSSTTSSGVLMPRLGPRPLVPTGMLTAAGGLVILATQLGLHPSYAGQILPALILTGAGLG